MSDYRRDLLFLLNDVARLLRTEADRRARADGLTRAQWGILIWLEREPGLSQRELAERLEVEPITAARLIDRLEGRGMVERRAEPGDRRVWRLHLCEAALPLLAGIAEHRREMLADLTTGLDPAAGRVLVEALVGMKATLAADRRPEPPADQGRDQAPGASARAAMRASPGAGVRQAQGAAVPMTGEPGAGRRAAGRKVA